MSELSTAPAIALLLRCGSTDAASAPGETLRLAAAVEDWPRFFALAARHAIIPLVDHALTIGASGTVPANVAAELRAASQRGALNSLMLSGELVSIMRAFADAGIDAIPFKGPTLAALVYGNLSLRQYQDLDILVHRADVDRARTALIALGYAPAIPYNEDQRAILMQTGHHEQLVRGDITVELHWSLNNRTLTHDAFERRWWESRQPISIGGMTMQTLGAERLLLYLCMHGGKHSWARLGWLCDFEFALRAYPDAVWSDIWSLSRENGAERMVGIGLALVEELLGGRALVSPARKNKVGDREVREVSTLLADRIRGDEIVDPYLDFRVQVRSRERWSDRLRYTWHVLAAPHPADIVLLGLPRTLYWMYYVLRPIRLVWKNVVKGLRPSRAS